MLALLAGRGKSMTPATFEATYEMMYDKLRHIVPEFELRP